ncbi:hypothetical protein AGDE_14359 [Angomonas deanei]|nr:hypothetical protein AGDE_14359 [Angomonas deanei]|eukprot:EPY20996.1 hypothetical protein AGDE_14359 [Angomonas deanei]
MKGIRNLVNFCLERPVYSTVQVNPKDWKDTLTVMIRQSFGEQPARLKSSTAAGFFSGVFLPAPLTETKFLVKLNSGQERHFFLSELLALFRETCATPDEWPVVPFRPSFFDSWPVTRQKIEQLWKEGYELNSTENGACTLKVDGEHVRQVVRLPADGSIFNSFYRELDRNGDADRETVKQCALEEIRHGTNLSYVKCLGYYFHGIQTQYQRVDGKRLLSARITPSLFATLAVVESSDGDQTKEYLAKLFLEKQFPQLSRLILLLHEVKRLLIELHSLGKECVLVFKDTSVRVVDAENHSVGEFSWDDPIQTTPHIIRVLNDMKQDSIQTLHTDSFRVDAALMASLLQQHKQFKRLYPSYDHRSQELALQGIDAETSRPITLKKVVVQSWDSVPVKLLSLYRELLPSLQKAVPPVGEDVVVHKAHLDKLFARPFTVSNYQSSTGWVAEVSVSSSILGFRGERPFTFRKRESVKNKANRHLLRALYVLFVVPVLQVRADFFQRIPEKKPTVSPKMLSGPEVGSVATVVGDLTQARSFLDFVSTSVKEQVLSLYGKSGTVALKLNNTLGFSLLYRPAAPRAVAKPSARRVKVKGGECVVLTTDVWSTNIWAPFHILLAVLQVLYKMGADELDVTLQDRWSKAIKEVTSVPNEAFVRLFFLSVFGWRTHAADGDMPPKESIYLKQHAVLLKHGLYQSTLSLVQYEQGSKTFERILCIGFGDDDGQSANSLYTNATREILTFFNVKKGEEISWAQLARQAEGVI